jgi:hypothetical protein
MSLIDSAKDAAKLVQQIGNIELYEKLIAIQQDALSLIDENRSLKDQIRDLKDEIGQIKKRVDLSDDMEYVEDGGFYIRKSERAAGKNIPYCPLCWTASNGAVVPLNPGVGDGFYKCAIHQTNYETRAYRMRQREAHRRAVTFDDRGENGWMG